MKTELRTRPDNGGIFLKTDVLDSSVSVVAPVPLRLRSRRRSGGTGTWIVNSRRLTGLAVLRIAFGAIWAVDASLKWQPAFQANFQQMLSDVAKGQPGFLGWWFALWQFVVSGRAPDVGAAIIYSLLFGALLLVDAGRYSVDALIERRILAWRWIAELRP